ncbi:MAG: hypothetical protein M3Y56_10470 [Armatimonadota bacterium]|nr:hypothetical protein [Armatimonadota bacterium]
MKDIHVEVLLACGYAIFLIAAAVILERLARHTHHRAKLYRNRGFSYQPHLDIWECPAGEPLHRRDTNPLHQVVRYQARAEKCNSCFLKEKCTDSSEGREILHSTQDWLETEIGRFHRGFSLALLGLGILIIVIACFRHHRPVETTILVSILAAVLLVSIVFARAFWKPVEKGAPQGSPGLLNVSPWDSGMSSGASRRSRPFS